MTKLQQKFNFLSFYSSLKNFQKERVDSPSEGNSFFVFGATFSQSELSKKNISARETFFS